MSTPPQGMPLPNPPLTPNSSGVRDVTDELAGRISTVISPGMMSTLLGPDIMRGAEDNSYLGKLTEAEAKQVVSRHFSVTRLTDMLIHEVANDQRFGYESVSEVIRHAVELFLQYLQENKMFLAEHQGFANDILRRQHEMRLDAERAKIRLEFSDSIQVLDKEMDMARQIGDWEFIGKRLEKYTDMLENCESETQRRLLREVLAESVATKAAVIGFYRWVNSEYRVPVDNWSEGWPELASRWHTWYSDWETT